MNDTWAVLIPILIVDILNPVLFAVMVYAAGTRRAVINSSAILLGHTLTYLFAGIILALGLERISERLSNPHTVDFVIGLVIGLLLLWAAYRSTSDRNKQNNTTIPELTPVKAAGYGAIINFIGIPFALPYFAALDQILKTELSVFNVIMVLIAYNLLYALPFMAVPAYTAISGERSQALLARINNIVDRASRYLMPILLALVGLALVIDAVSFLTRGKALF